MDLRIEGLQGSNRKNAEGGAEAPPVRRAVAALYRE